MNSAEGSQIDPYHQIAELYDMEHDDFTEDVDCLLAIAGQMDDPLLEIGCGSGRVLVPLAEANHAMVGIDQSAVMLERARHRIAARGQKINATLVARAVADMATVPGGPFGGILFTLNALMHLDTQEAQQRALNDATSLLKPGGSLFIDLQNPMPDYLTAITTGPTLEWSGRGDDGSTIDKTAWREIDPVNQTIDTTLWYDRVSSDGALRRTRTSFSLRYLHASELLLMLTTAGFEYVHFFGSYELAPLSGASERMIVLASLPD